MEDADAIRFILEALLKSSGPGQVVETLRAETGPGITQPKIDGPSPAFVAFAEELWQNIAAGARIPSGFIRPAPPVRCSAASARRIGDMDPGDFLEIIKQDDGDLVVVVRGKDISGETVRVSVEFCAGAGGGGRSMRTRHAIELLMSAMEEDNKTNPIK